MYNFNDGSKIYWVKINDRPVLFLFRKREDWWNYWCISKKDHEITSPKWNFVSAFFSWEQAEMAIKTCMDLQHCKEAEVVCQELI